MDTLTLIMIGAAVFLLAGTVKGTVGLGLPTTAIGVLSLVIAPRTAIVMTLLPMLIANAWQVWRMGGIVMTARRYAPFAVTLMLGVAVTTLLAAQASDRVIYGTIGGVIVMFAVVNLAVTVPPLPRRLDKPAQVFFGAIAGIMGGITAVWAPPMAIYLTAMQVQKDEFVRATGLLIFLGCLPLIWGYAQTGQMTGQLTLVSALMIGPTLAGFALGERLRRGMDQQRFRKVFLWIFLLLGLNLIRRAIWG
jgi:hypothetical protein